MKILHVLNVPFVLPYILGNQIEYFNDIGTEVHIACSNGPQLDNYKKKWNFVFLELKINRKISLFDDIFSIFVLIKYIKKNNINVVVGHTPKGALIAMISAFLCKVNKRIYFRHGLMFETSKGIKRKILIYIEQFTSTLSTKVICVSNSVLDKSIEYKITIKNKLLLINNGSCNGIDSLNRFNIASISNDFLKNKRKEYNISINDVVVGFVGRLSKDKGINELIQAWNSVKNRYTNVKLLLCGPVDERDPINKNLLNKILNDSTIIYTGEVIETEYIYSLLSIFILPSYREGFPTVVLEASSMNLPVITTKNTGCIDSIIENITGIFTEINPDCISDKIEFYINNPELSILHGRNGRKFVVNNFNQKQIWNKLALEYKND